MNTWTTVIAAGLLSLAVKLAGYVVPQRWFAHPRLARTAGLMPVALLAALVATQAFTGSGGRLVIDARVAAVAVACAALALRAPFLVVVVLAAAAAALLRAAGLG